MLFSILIPVYNVEKWLRECVESVLSQDEQDFEIILVDDGSTDGSGVICDEYAVHYSGKIRVIHKENEGLLLTRRAAIKAAAGEWFVHLDSDDFMLPGALSSIRKAAEENAADLVLYKIVYGRQDTSDRSIHSKLPFTDGQKFEGDAKHALYMQFLAGGYLTAIYQKAARRDIVDIETDYRQWKNVSLMEDHLQSLPLLHNARCPVFIDKPLIYYRWNENSITKKKGYASYLAAFGSRRTVYQEETRYRELWKLGGSENKLICTKHIKQLCGVVGNIACAVTKQESRDFKRFICELAKDPLWQRECKAADNTALGRVSRICCKLVAGNRPGMILLLYKRLLPFMSRKKGKGDKGYAIQRIGACI